MLPVAFLCLAIYVVVWPLFWLAGLPNDIRYERLRERATKDVDVALDEVIRVRWYMRQHSSMASGIDDLDYFVLTRSNGSTITIYDNSSLKERLARRGLLPERATYLGCTELGFMSLFWLMLGTVLVTLFIISRLVC